ARPETVCGVHKLSVGGQRRDPVQEDAGGRGGSVVLPGRLGQETGDGEPGSVIWRSSAPGDGNDSIARVSSEAAGSAPRWRGRTLDRPDKTLRSASPRLRNRMPVRRSVLASDVALRSKVRRIHAPVSPKAV